MRILLAGEGYHILEAENGLRALELYRGQTLVYSSFAPKGGIPEKTERDPGDRVAFYEWSPGYTLNFADGEAKALLYYNGLNDYYSTGCDILNMLCLLWWFPGFFLFNSRKIIRYILQLSEEIQAMEGGDLEHPHYGAGPRRADHTGFLSGFHAPYPSPAAGRRSTGFGQGEEPLTELVETLQQRGFACALELGGGGCPALGQQPVCETHSG